ESVSRLRERRRPRRRDANQQAAGKDAGAPRFMERLHFFLKCVGTMNLHVAQAFQPAGSRDIPVPCFCFGRLESRPNRQTGMSAPGVWTFWGRKWAVVPKGLPIIARQFTAGNTWERSESRRDG